jgi:general secretion pathway protein N
LALLLLAIAGLGAKFGPHPDDPALAPALPQVQLTEIGPRLGPPSQYAEVAQRPLLIPSRRPAAVSDAGDQDAPLDFTLTGVLIAGEFRAVMLQSPDGSRNQRVREGDLVEGTSWRLVSLEPRAAVFEGPEGQRRLDLRVYDGSADPVRSQTAAVPPPPGTSRSPRRGAQAASDDASSDAPAEAPAKEAEAMSEEQQVEAIRRRIEARRAQMREQSAREGQKVE